ncbi:MAG TPA: FMN-binding negative transcriptional regulator [Chryseolinea sp.]|nr:FMN-binding negative transcriptional regulator [Chryseolinea sp.]HPM28970.1 FMN-binding negative transcriptional regulator [Chryseolinea sp.]
MYTAKINQNENREELLEFIHANGFAILVSTVEGKPWATHVPLLLSHDKKKLQGHIAKGNKQWKEWNADTEVLAIFQGPHAYISSSWYDHENVSTWNYLAVHVYGKLKIQTEQELLNSLKDLTDKYEKQSEKPVSVDRMNPDYVKKQMLGIVGFEIEILKIEATYKLSQNRDSKNHDAIVSQLEKLEDHGSRAIATEMKKAGHS